MEDFVGEKHGDEIIFQLRFEHKHHINIDDVINSLKENSAVKEIHWNQ